MNVLLVLGLLACATTEAKLLKYPKNYVKSAIEGRVIGGRNATEGEAPFQVSLQTSYGYHYCGGAILDKDWIATAAHCLTYKEPSDFIVATGTIEWERPNATYALRAFYSHCGHSLSTGHNDIALIRLNSSIVFNEKTQPIALPTEQMTDGDEVILTGWGTTELYGDTPDKLQVVNLKYLPHQQCKEMHEKNAVVDVGNICTFTQIGEGACHGDSGGPLVSDGKLVGLVNWGMPCGIGYPDVHASTYFYRDWIRRVMSGNSKCVV